IGNAPGFSPDSSVVLDRVGQVSHARAVADALGISRVESRPDANLYLDVTVVLGKDWAARNPERPAAAAQ
ncbi:MAG TPA: LytR C-terminal domain-containing protein, partial [Longimicrobium sp.]|nr:LytR C-terminal domain-containing protein [Longimicrobium sp.]